MSDNVTLTDNIIAKEALMIVENELTCTKLISRRFEKKFAQEGHQIGDTYNLRLPVRWEGREGEEMVIEGAQERSIAMKIDRLIGQDLAFSSVDLTLKIEQFRERYLDTACATIANRIDKAVLAQYANCPNFAGTPGTVPQTLDPYFDASVILSNYGAPAGKGKRHFVISPRMETTIVNALKGLFQAAQAIAEQYETGGMGRVIGFNWHMDQNVQAHTIGVLGGTPLVDGAQSSGSTVLLKGFTAAAATRVNRGDPVTFALVNGCNPMGKDDTGELRQFVATQDTASDGAGAMTLPIFPTLELTGPYQNISAGLADNAAVKVFGHASSYASVVTKQGMAFHKEWLQAAFVDLELPKGMEMSARANSNKLGLSIRIVKGFDIRLNKHLCRLDVLFGLKQAYEDFAVRLAGS